ncbi:MAG: NifB/NifX family molybdenum-iron cluster-binding protein [Anaerolineae bacterium]|nr:NifB/NifX family molybdenum-iron cluster-binding protein [Anaerolineae bacterium]
MTKIALAVLDASGLDAQISPHFGRCPYFTVVEVEGAEVRAVETVANPHYPNHEPGQIPAFIHSLGAQVMLAGGMGGRAVAFFQQYGVEPATGAAGTVRESLTRYLGGELTGAAPCSESVEHGHG